MLPACEAGLLTGVLGGLWEGKGMCVPTSLPLIPITSPDSGIFKENKIKHLCQSSTENTFLPSACFQQRDWPG